MQSNENQNNTQPQAPKTKKGLVFYLKLLAIIGLSGALLVSIMLAVVFHKLTTDNNLEKILNAEISKATQMDIAFESFSISFPTIKILNTKIATETQELKLQATIKEITVRPDLIAALKGRFVMAHIGLEGADSYLKLKKQAEKAAPAPKTAAPTAKTSANTVKPVEPSAKPAGGSSATTSSTTSSTTTSATSSGTATTKQPEPQAQQAKQEPNKEPKQESKKEPKAPATQAATNALETLELPFQSILLKNIALNLDDEIQAQQYQITLKTAQISGSMLSASIPVYASLEVKDLINLEVTGTVLWPSQVTAALDASVVDFKKLLVYVPEEYREQAAAFKSAKTTLKIKYDLKTNGLELEDGQATLEPGIKASVTAKLNSLAPLLGQAKVQVSPISIPFVMELAKAYIPQEYGLKVTKGTVGANAELIFEKNDEIKISATANPEKIELTADLLPESLTIARAPVAFKNNVITLTKGELELAKQALSVPEFSYDLNTNQFKASANMSSNVEALWHGLLFPIIKKMDNKELANLGLDTLKTAGGLEVGIKASGTVEKPMVEGRAQLKSLTVAHGALERPVEGISGPVTFSMKEVGFKGLSASFGKTKLGANGSVALGDEVTFDAAVEADANLEELYQMVKPMLGEAGAEVVLKGSTALQVKLAGSASKPVVNGNFVAKDVYFAHPSVIRPVERVNGPVEFDLEKIVFNGLSAYWGSSKATISGTVSDFEQLLTDMSFVVEPLNITDAAGFFLKGSGYEVEGVGKGKGKVAGPLSDIRVTCEAEAPLGIVKAELIENSDVFRFPYKALKADCVFYKNVLRVNAASLEIFDGNITAVGSADIGVEPIAFDFDTKLNLLKAEAFLKENVDKKYHDTLVGGINGQLKLKGDVTGLSSLMGSANLAMPSGAYNSPPLLKKVAEKLNAPKFASGSIKNYFGTTRIEKGRMISDDSALEVQGGKMSFTGSVGLDTTIAGTGKLTLNKELFKDDQTMLTLFTGKDSLDLPVTIKGTLVSPDVGIPMDDMLKKAKEKVKAAVTDSIKELGKDLGKDLKEMLLNTGKGTESGATAKPAVDTSQKTGATEEKALSKAEEEKAKLQESLKKEASKVEDKLKKGLNKLFK
jgi:hypothetical protein